ncbi:hypothetical protein I4U23_011689 [Adineta vaga]|nr:hypothetical protein I4U23_011689 [Adineta vaga]
MLHNHTLFLMVILVLVAIANINAMTWFPDPQRAAEREARWKRYKALPYKTLAAVEGVCGKVGDNTCWQPVGRPSDASSDSCDKACCHAGFLTGFCHGGVEVGVKIINPYGPGQPEYKPILNNRSGCACTNDITDAKCGPDGSFIGIRCPFDQSACARKCCREGHSGGKCGGFLRLKCKCN